MPGRARSAAGGRSRRARRRAQRGAGLVEYLIVVVLVALLCATGFRMFGGAVSRTVRGQADCVADLATCEAGRVLPGIDHTVPASSAETDSVTLVRTVTPTTALPTEPVDDGEIVQVDSPAFEKISDGIRFPFGAYPEDVSSFLQQNRTRRLVVPKTLEQSLDGFLRLYGGSPGSQSTLRDYQRLLSDYRKAFAGATQPVPPDAVDEFFRTWTPTAKTIRPSTKPTNTNRRALPSSRTKTSTRALPTTSPTEESSQTEQVEQQLSEREVWISADFPFDGTQGNEALRRAAPQLVVDGQPITAQEIDYVIASIGPLPYVHMGSDTSVPPGWTAGQEVTRQTLEAQANKNDGAKWDNGKLVAKYEFSERQEATFVLARQAIAGGYPSIDDYVEAQIAANPKGFVDYLWDLAGGALNDGIWEDLKGTWEMITDPVGTVKSIWELAALAVKSQAVIYFPNGPVLPNPFYDPAEAQRADDLVKAVWKEIADYCTNTPARCVGRGIYEIVTLVIAPAKVLKVAKVRYLAKITKALDKLADTSKLLKTAEKLNSKVLKKVDDLLEKTPSLKRVVKKADVEKADDFVPDGTLGSTFKPGELVGQGEISPIPIPVGDGPAKVIKMVGTDEKLASWISEFEFPRGVTTVVLHGDTFTTLRKIGPKMEIELPVNHRDLTRYIAQNGGRGKGPLLLMACKTGDASRTWPFAQHLANKLGREVWAPTEEIVFGSTKDGTRKLFVIATELPDKTVRYGAWRKFEPRVPK